MNRKPRFATPVIALPVARLVSCRAIQRCQSVIVRKKARRPRRRLAQEGAGVGVDQPGRPPSSGHRHRRARVAADRDPGGSRPRFCSNHGCQQRLWRQRSRIRRERHRPGSAVGPLEHLLLVGEGHAGHAHDEDDHAGHDSRGEVQPEQHGAEKLHDDVKLRLCLRVGRVYLRPERSVKRKMRCRLKMGFPGRCMRPMKAGTGRGDGGTLACISTWHGGRAMRRLRPFREERHGCRRSRTFRLVRPDDHRCGGREALLHRRRRLDDRALAERRAAVHDVEGQRPAPSAA